MVKRTVLPADLGLRNDQLGGVGVVGSSQGVLEHADSAQHVAGNLDLVGEVRWVSEDHLGLGLELHLGLNAGHGGLDAGSDAILVQHLVDAGVQHVGTAVNGGQTGEALGQLAESVEGVDVWGLSVPGNRVAVQADTLNGIGSDTSGGHVCVVEVQGHGVANEVPGGLLETEFVVHILHGAGAHVETWNVSAMILSAGVTGRSNILTLVCSSVLDVECANPFDEALHPALLEHAHEGRLQGLCGIRGDLGDGGLGAGTLLHEAACDLLELEVSGDIGGDEDVGQLARGHEELGDQVDVPVVGAAVFLPWLVARAVVSVLLEELEGVR